MQPRFKVEGTIVTLSRAWGWVLCLERVTVVGLFVDGGAEEKRRGAKRRESRREDRHPYSGRR